MAFWFDNHSSMVHSGVCWYCNGSIVYATNDNIVQNKIGEIDMIGKQYVVKSRCRILNLIVFLSLLVFFLIPGGKASAFSVITIGDGSECNPYQISTKAQLEELADSVNANTTHHYANKYFKLTNSITTAVTTVIGRDGHPFCGDFDGGSNTVRLGITGTSGDYSRKGLFGYIGSGANIHDVTTSGSISCEYCGGIVGEIVSYSSNVTISNCTNGATLHATSSGCGGIVCFIYYSSNVTITNCVNEAPITCDWYEVGGIVARVSTSETVKITHCRNKGSVTVTSGWTGGICGQCESSTIATSEIYDCENESSATIVCNTSSSSCDIGGVVGQVNGFVVDKCANYATVQCGKVYNVGGIVGRLNNAIIRNSFNRGNVSSVLEGNWVSNGIGGVAGCVSLDASTYINNCYNIGNVTSTSTDLFCCGGVVGYLTGGSIRNCYNGGNLSFHASCTSSGNVAGRLYTGANLQYCYFRSGMLSDRCVGDQGSATVSNNSSFSHAMSPMTAQCKITTAVSGIAANTDLVDALNYWRTNISTDPNAIDVYVKWVDDASPWENLGMPKFFACTPITISTFSVTPSSGQNTLEWTASPTSVASSYTIYWECPHNIISPVYSSPYSHTGLTSGAEYCYQVMAVGDGEPYCAENPRSVKVCETIPTCTPLNVTGLTVTQPNTEAFAEGRKLHVVWNTTSGATGYKLYYGINEPGGGGTVREISLSGTSYDADLMTNGQEYHFAVKAVGGDCADNPLSGIVSKTPECRK